MQYVIRFLFSVQVRTESQLIADPTVRAAATKTDILFSVGVRQQEALQILRCGAAPDALQLAFDGDATLEAANRLQVCGRRDLRHLMAVGCSSLQEHDFLLAPQLVDACTCCRCHHAFDKCLACTPAAVRQARSAPKRKTLSTAHPDCVREGA